MFKKFLVKVIPVPRGHDEGESVRVVFYVAATSAKHECMLSLSELSSVICRPVSEVFKFSPKEVQCLFKHMERTLPSFASSEETNEAEAELKAVHGLLREALAMEKEKKLLDALERAKICISSSRHARRGLEAKGIKGGPLEAGVKNAISQAYNLMGSIYAAQGKQSKSLACHTLAAKEKPESNISRDVLADAVRDVEDYLEDFGLKALQDPANFACNGCGECCRSREKIYLSPYDVYAMTRAPALSQYRVRSTLDLHASTSLYKGVFKWGHDDWGFPSCYLSPASETAGHCRFSYPVFKKSQDSHNPQVLTYESTTEYLTFYGRSFEQHEHQWEDKGKAAKWLEEEEEMEMRYGEVYPVMNRTGRQALGCMLGSAAMPLGCSSFPFIPESHYADPDGGVLDMDMSSELFVVPTKHCEGFQHVEHSRDSKNEDPRGSTSSQQLQLQLFADAYPARGNPSATILHHARPDEARYEEWRWFLSLRRAIHSQLTPYTREQLHNDRFRAVRTHLSHVLTQVWYNFDILAHPRRPMKSVSRLKREIWQASVDLVAATNTFFGPLYKASEEGAGVEELEEAYKEMVAALGILKSN